MDNHGGDQDKRLRVMALAALGVVYGDIGTSPIYAMRECFHGEFATAVTESNVLGILSLMFWSLFVIVTLKYLTFIFMADNKGEGGVIALTALVMNTLKNSTGRKALAVSMGLFAASLLYGDGMITPAISVLSAVEGLEVVTPVFQPYVIPITLVILLGLFLLQRRGTGGIGALFGPVMLVWFSVIGLLGFVSLVRDPRVLQALWPGWGARFILHNGFQGFLVLGAVFLVVTGAEALYADMGHFGRAPIRRAWFTVALPALLCNYFGQGALLLREPDLADRLFYALVPHWLLLPLVVLATMATIIASQAVISGAFSLTKQAMQLGYVPRLRIVQTSASEIGQIYIPQINWILAAATILLVLGFGSSSKLAAAYGVAVTTTMLTASVLFFIVARYRWHWSLPKAVAPTVLFLAFDITFFLANISKIAHGAWFPLVIGGIVFTLLTTWNRGRSIIWSALYANNPTLPVFLERLPETNVARVPGAAIYMAGSTASTPPALLKNLQHNKVIHQDVVILTITTEEQPFADEATRIQVDHFDHGFHRVQVRFGFMEHPDVVALLARLPDHGLVLDMEDVSFFLGRENFKTADRPVLPIWRQKVFAFLSRNAVGATTYFHIPPKQVIEIGTQVEM